VIEAPTRLISGTRISQIVGVSPYGGPYEVYREMVEGWSQPQNRFMSRGTMMEPHIRRMYQERTKLQLEQKPSILRHHQYEWATYSPDDLPIDLTGTLACGVVDYKSANVSTIESGKYGEEFTDDIPDHYRLQLAWGMACTDRDWSHLFVVFGVDQKDGSFALSEKWKPRLYVVHRDLDLERDLLKAGEHFWTKHILTKTPPIRQGKKRKAV
jgi:putative phage-type endonuclease